MASARGRAIGALTLGGAMLVAVPATPAAASEEPAAPVQLAEAALASVTADLDGDGEREIVLLVTDDLGSTVILEVWAFGGDAWALEGRANLLRHAVAGSELVAVDPTTDGIGLLVLDDGPAERVVVATVGDAEASSGCCLTLADAVISPGGVSVRTSAAHLGPATNLAVTDTDGDGRDELLATTGNGWTSELEQDVTYRLLRPDGDAGWSAHPVALPDATQPVFHLLTMDSDGVPGDDLIVQSEDGGTVHRFVADGSGGLVRDASAAVGGASPINAWVDTAADGRVVLQDGRRAFIAEWPRGGELTVIGELGVDEDGWAQVIGAGPNARIAWHPLHDASSPYPDTMRIFDLDLELIETVTTTPTVERLAEIVRFDGSVSFEDLGHAMPWGGRVPGGTLSGADLFIVSGNLVTLDPDGDVRVESIGATAGLSLLGLAGPDDGWVLVTSPFGYMPRDAAYLHPGPLGPLPVSVMPLDAVLAPDPADGLTLALGGAVEIEPDADGGRRVVAAGPFSATISAPGSTVLGLRDGTVIFRGEAASNAPAVVEVAPRRSEGEGDVELTLGVVVVLPTGQVLIDEWEATILREPPELSADAAEVPLLGTRAAISGTASTASTVTVDGRPVELDADGSFSASVDAPPWPRRIVVTATDPVGREATTELEVVGVVDYRGWPWPVIVGVVTVIGGGAMYLRAPRWVATRARQEPVRTADDDARLEELDGDWA